MALTGVNGEEKRSFHHVTNTSAVAQNVRTSSGIAYS